MCANPATFTSFCVNKNSISRPPPLFILPLQLYSDVFPTNFVSALLYFKTKRKSFFGDDLLLQGATPQLPSALKSLTAGFGMGPGVSSSLESPKKLYSQYLLMRCAIGALKTR